MRVNMTIFLSPNQHRNQSNYLVSFCVWVRLSKHAYLNKKNLYIEQPRVLYHKALINSMFVQITLQIFF